MKEFIDQTILLPTKNKKDYDVFYSEVINYNFYAACLPPALVKEAVSNLKNSTTRVCTVVGFANGYQHSLIKLAETELALSHGAQEIDMVANLYWVKNKSWALIEDEIKAVKKICNNNLLKVIVESSLLDEDEIIGCCKALAHAGADYIKTSTGFHGPGAKKEDILLMKKNLVNTNVKIKASGGIRDLKTAQDFISIGCQRIGTSSGVKIIQELKGTDKSETITRSNY